MYIQEIIDRNRATDEHFFDAATMRSFRSRVLPYVAEGPGGVYFLTSEQYCSDGAKSFSVRRFILADGTIAPGVDPRFDTLADAKRHAREAAGPGATVTTGPPPVMPSETDDLARALAVSHGVAEQLRRLSRRHLRICERMCNEDDPQERLPAAAERLEAAFRALLPEGWEDEHQRDPRGCTLRATRDRRTVYVIPAGRN